MNPFAPYSPRAWQSEALPVVVNALRNRERPLITAVMGAGKSIFVGALVATALPRAKGAIVIVAPSEMLVRQLSATIAEMCGPDNVGVFYGRRKQPERPVIVCCAPSLANLHIALLAAGRSVSVLILDEAHKSEAAQVRDIVPALNPTCLLGVTATPYRSVSAESLSLYSDVAYRYSWGDAKRDGVLVPARYVWDDSADERDDLDSQCLNLILKHAPPGPGVVSARSIADAEAFARYLSESGVPAEAIHSQLTPSAKALRLQALQAGSLRCLVHVSMLAEGVDFPWLMWLCLRRPVGARVRLVQEVGRPLRSAPGKTEAVIIDPHNLIGALGLAHKDAIGEALQEMADAETDGEKKEYEAKEPEPLPPGPTVTRAMAWTQTVLLSMQEIGSADFGPPAGRWRGLNPSPRQLVSLEKMGRAWASYLPDGVGDYVLALSRRHIASTLQRGAVSDLLSILHAVASQAPEGGWEARRGWSGPDWPDLDLPVLEGEVQLGLGSMWKEEKNRKARERRKAKKAGT